MDTLIDESRIFYLDWKSDRLFGWENNKSDLVIDAIFRGILLGDVFPAVMVHRFKGNVYYLSPLTEAPDGLCDGGHFRALGHYIANKPLRCQLMEGPPILLESMVIEIPEITIVTDTGQYERNKKRFSSYR